MKQPLRVALCGYPGTGKSSIAKELMRVSGGSVLSFAHGLKTEVATALAAVDGGTPYDYFDEMVDPHRKDKYRALLQVWGTEFRRAQDPDYWVEKMRGTLSVQPNTSFAVDDCRFDNEYQMLRAYGFIFVRLEPGATMRAMSKKEAAHESEAHWPKFAFDHYLTFARGPAIQARNLLHIFKFAEEAA